MISGASTPIRVDRTLRQTLVVSGVITVALIIGALFTLGTWRTLCSTGIMECFSNPNPISTMTYLILGAIRPFTLLPQSIFWLISAHMLDGSAMGMIKGFVLISFGTLISFFGVYAMGHYIYSRLAKPWLFTHLPKNLKKAQKHASSLIIQTQLMSIFHKDLLTFIFGLFGMPFKKSFQAMAYVECARVALLCILCLKLDPLKALLSCYACCMTAQILYVISKQLQSTIQGRSYLRACKSQWYETFCEIQTNNMTDVRVQFQGTGEPILLLYGFFASRRTLTVMEKMLRHRGYEVFTINLGGLFDVFFTKSIPSSAESLDAMLKPILAKHNLSKISIVAHSKGGLVAAWWMLRLKGHRYCKHLVTLGSPFGGTYATWVALITPLGLFWQDVWQMRPRSRLLKALQESYIPQDVNIYCLYSSQDRITRHKKGVFTGIYGHTENIHAIPMHQYSHFQYLYKKGVIEKIHHLLTKKPNSQMNSSQITQRDLS